MKPKTKAMLSDLLERHSRASLVALRSDIEGLSEQEFSNLIDEIGRAKQNPAKLRATKQPIPADDKPTTRIAHLLRVKLGFPDPHAEASLREALLAAGVRSNAIPATAASLEAWLDLLLENVADSKVMAIAKRLEPISG